MKVLVLSDIHANFTALQEVLNDAAQVDEVWCLGDLVGYGPDPNEVVDRVRGLPNLTCLLGNHDAAVINHIPLATFNGDARRSLQRHQRLMTADGMDFLRSLPQDSLVRDGATLAHGSPRDPLWEYIVNTLSARLNFDQFATPWCFVGHTHVACVFALDPTSDRVTLDGTKAGETMKLGAKLILNPGSVGQPRDRDPRAAYAIYDSEAMTWEARRVEYDVAAVQQRIHQAGLPERHALRLAEGW
jgi:diadenosine tetraphosphatase ApaH/serine/threonine PP2A family protein phosphatase